MPFEIHKTAGYKTDFHLAEKQHKPMVELETVIETLARGERPDRAYGDHALQGNFNDYRECHIRPDWVLVYKVDNANRKVTLCRLGTHDRVIGK